MNETKENSHPLEIRTYLVGKEEINAVNARTLWRNLQSKQQFADWIKRRLKDTLAEENYDYFTIIERTQPAKEPLQNCSNNGDDFKKSTKINKENISENHDNTRFHHFMKSNQTNNYGGDKKSVDYIITLDLAKEFAMLEKNQKGKEIRRYFIEFEKKMKEKMKDFDERLKEQRNWTRQLQEKFDKLSKHFRAMEVKQEYEALKKEGYIF
ncbi:antA/AntB antirepressor family protein (plasmid) [Campylobacter fetus]|uniref:AntA/AntB antirepressor family protein n=1 Tax=Campylobacter fetus TaxID=196 RepID=A0A974MUV4_CAMFE|nr:antA/AntB antirepressor family protein [Campylobacter fetus]OCS32905.1 hypothetical protein AWR31_08175 [Campylobacter fetus subsp. venerealis]QMS59908.1 antA/AntB antirepressor family protein [Campylobacter fetus]